MYKATKDGIEINGLTYDVNIMLKEVNDAKLKHNPLALFTIEWVGGRNFDGAKETIIVKKDNAEKLKKLLTGAYVYFGEIAGKHSEIYGDIEEDEISIEYDNDKINKFIIDHNNSSKYNHSFICSICERINEEPELYSFSEEELNKLLEV